MTIEADSLRDAHSQPGAVTLRRGKREARQTRATRGEHRMITFGIELDAVAHLLRDRRFQASVVTGVIGLVALAGLARENREHNRARLAAWYRKNYLRDQRQARTRPA
jgi:hypothetical protein